EVRLEILHELEGLLARLVVDLARITTGLPQELRDGDAHRSGRNALDGDLSDAGRFLDGLADGAQLVPRGGRLAAVLLELRGVVVGDLDVRARREEVVRAVELEDLLEGLDGRAGHDLLGVRDLLDQVAVHERREAVVIHHEEVDLDIPGFDLGSEGIDDVLRLDVDDVDFAAGHLGEAAHDFLVEDLCFGLGHRDRDAERLARPVTEGQLFILGGGCGGRLPHGSTGAERGGEDRYGDPESAGLLQHVPAVEAAIQILGNQVPCRIMLLREQISIEHIPSFRVCGVSGHPAPAHANSMFPGLFYPFTAPESVPLWMYRCRNSVMIKTGIVIRTEKVATSVTFPRFE